VIYCLQPMVNALSSFEDINTIIIKSSGSEIDLNRCIETTKQRLKDLPPSKERRYIRVWHKSNDRDFKIGHNGQIHKSDIDEYVRDFYTEIPI
jgi:hypothetical protein